MCHDPSKIKKIISDFHKERNIIYINLYIYNFLYKTFLSYKLHIYSKFINLILNEY